ncbi:putative hydrolase [Cercophora samala]|uniref:Hydrolase n=1 Tax=Cercophora samala TaxID=330535 RepID=A0AA39ZHJ4_9PEZI|nr:putative hydrolase [Cercophora samala]
MSTFHHPSHPTIPITIPDGLSQDQVLNFHPFTSWLSTLTHSLSSQSTPSHPFSPSPYTLRSVKIQSFDLFGSSRVGFLKLQADVRNDKNEWLPGAVFLRGPSVAMLVMLIPDDDDDDDAPPSPASEERYVLLTVQPRIAAGSLEFVELPAGMVDEQGEFAGTAAKEMEEELGMRIGEEELVNLSEMVLGGGEGEGEEDGGLGKGVYPSPGACDEFIPIFMHERRVSRETLKEWEGKLTGLREHGERISLRLVKMGDLWRVGGRDGKTLAAVALWEGLRREGRV